MLKKIFKVSYIFLFLILPNNTVLAWTITDTFESGAVGQKTESTAVGAASVDAGVNAVYFSSITHNSSAQSAAITWNYPTASEGWGYTNILYNYPSSVGDGGEIWFRTYVYLPTTWEFGTSQVKTMRIAMPAGHLSIMRKYSDNLGNIFFLSNEISSYDSSWQTPVQTISASDTLGEWVCLEIYTKLSITNGIIRIWKNGVLFAEQIGDATMSAGSLAYRSQIEGIWNSPGTPQTQTTYWDDIVVTNEQPIKQDASGNYMIGPTDWGSPVDTTPPLAPAGLVVN